MPELPEVEALARSGCIGDAPHVHAEILEEFQRAARALEAEAGVIST